MKTNRFGMALASVLVGAGLMFPQTARAHCDTMDGPVVKAAQQVADQVKQVAARMLSDGQTIHAENLQLRDRCRFLRQEIDRPLIDAGHRSDFVAHLFAMRHEQRIDEIVRRE